MKIKVGLLGSEFRMRVLLTAVLTGGIVAWAGCGSTPAGTKKNEFFTSGSPEADQRASQVMAKNQQLSGADQGDVKKAKVAKADQSGSTTNKAAQAEGKLSLYDRLGSEAGLSNIVSDFLPRVLNDPRVNWERKGVSGTKVFFFFHRHTETQQWSATPDKMAALQKHLIEFLALTTGGPSKYEGREIKSVHAGMHITNPEFDAVIGDMKASLDRLQIPDREQKELLAVIESTRPEIVTER